MAVKVEVGAWTASGGTPDTISLADGAFGTPIAIIAWMVGQAGVPAEGSFNADVIISVGFGTRRGGSTQSGCIAGSYQDNVGTAQAVCTRNTTLLHVLTNAGATDYTVALDSFGDAAFTVSYSSAANASGDIYHYVVFGGTDLTDANVINQTLDSTTLGDTEAVTGVGFLPSVVFGLDADSVTAGTLDARFQFSFGCAASASQFWCVSANATDGDTMTNTMNHNNGIRSDSFIERLAPNADGTNARWDLGSFDSDGCTLGVVDAPGSTDRVAPLLFIQGGVWEAGSKAKLTTSTGGDDTFTLTNSALTPVGLIMAMTGQTVDGVVQATFGMCMGAGSTPNPTRGSAVNNVVGVVSLEAINTSSDRFHATDAVIEEIAPGAPAREASEAWYDTSSTGSFIIEWANPNGTSAALVKYLVVGGVPELSWAPKYPTTPSRQISIIPSGPRGPKQL